MKWHQRLVPLRVLVFAILALGVVRLIVALAMPQTASSLAPDEGTYASLAGIVGSGGDWVTWNYNWGASLYPGSRALLGPASVLISFGLDDLTAVRVVSVVYAVGSQLLMLTIARLSRQRLTSDEPGGVPMASWAMLGLAAFVLLPSNVVWSNLGLREAACSFWILAAVASTAYLFTSKDWRWKIVWGASIVASIAMAFQSRVYLAVALVLALAVGIVWFGMERPRISVTLATSVIVGALAGVTLSLPAPQPSVQAPLGQGGLVQEGLEAAPSVLSPDNYLQRGSGQRAVSAEGAESAIPTDSCTGMPDPGSLRWCEISRLPGAAFAVMFRPLWPLDSPVEWSMFAVLASVENVLWLTLVGAVLWVLVRRRCLWPRVATIALAYGSIVVAGMAVLEGNFGTAFRHKSSVLWVLALVLILAGGKRLNRRSPEKQILGAPAVG